MKISPKVFTIVVTSAFVISLTVGSLLGLRGENLHIAIAGSIIVAQLLMLLVDGIM